MSTPYQKNKQNKDEAKKAMLSFKICELYADGQTTKQIAALLDCTVQWVRKVFRNEMARAFEHTLEDMQGVLKADLGITEVLITTFMKEALKGDVKAAHLVMTVLERRAKYLGLDAPAKTEIRGQLESIMLGIPSSPEGLKLGIEKRLLELGVPIPGKPLVVDEVRLISEEQPGVVPDVDTQHPDSESDDGSS
jgi:hypothetical protein